jgi:hypothetical protein
MLQRRESSRTAGIVERWDDADATMRHFQRLGMLAREEVPVGKGAGRGRPRRYFLDREFFAFRELRALLWALVATLYEDIAGIARALGRDDPTIEAHVRKFERATTHLRDW